MPLKIIQKLQLFQNAMEWTVLDIEVCPCCTSLCKLHWLSGFWVFFKMCWLPLNSMGSVYLWDYLSPRLSSYCTRLDSVGTLQVSSLKLYHLMDLEKCLFHSSPNPWDTTFFLLISIYILTFQKTLKCWDRVRPRPKYADIICLTKYWLRYQVFAIAFIAFTFIILYGGGILSHYCDPPRVCLLRKATI